MALPGFLNILIKIISSIQMNQINLFWWNIGSEREKNASDIKLLSFIWSESVGFAVALFRCIKAPAAFQWTCDASYKLRKYENDKRSRIWAIFHFDKRSIFNVFV